MIGQVTDQLFGRNNTLYLLSRHTILLAQTSAFSHNIIRSDLNVFCLCDRSQSQIGLYLTKRAFHRLRFQHIFSHTGHSQILLHGDALGNDLLFVIVHHPLGTHLHHSIRDLHGHILGNLIQQRLFKCTLRLLLPALGQFLSQVFA